LERLTRGRAPIIWRTVTVNAIVPETAHAKSIALDVPGWPGHLAGQHVDVRLTADDGYQAERSYSIASAPESSELSLTVELFEEGEVSPYLVEDLTTGDQFEVRGPVGGYFTWSVQDGGPLLLVAGGSGLVPLMAMLRHHEAQSSTIPIRLLLSARTIADVLYRDEIAGLAGKRGVEVTYTLTREQPAGWTGASRRVDAEMLREVGPEPAEHPKIFVCGPTAFVESVADRLVELGHDPSAVRAERFGPTGQ
jgi:ferredoxin-NADP reductase